MWLVSVLVLLGGCGLLVAAMVAYDVWVIRRYGVDSSISRGMRRLGELSPFFPFCVGLAVGLVVGALAAHFWFSV